MALSSFARLANATAAVQLPVPTLTKDFHLECDLNPKLSLGSGPGDTVFNWISFTGGTWNATWGNGTIEVLRSSIMLLGYNADARGAG